MRTAVYILVALLLLGSAGYLLVLTGGDGDSVPSTPDARPGEPPAALLPVVEAPVVEAPAVESPIEQEQMGPPLSARPPVDGADALPVTAVAAEAGLRIVGTVTDRITKRPVAGAQIEVRGSRGAPPRLATTDVDGRYVVAGVLPSHGSLVAKAEHYSSTRQTIAVDSDERADLRIDPTLLPQARISGRVHGPDGAPLAGAGINPFLMLRAIGVTRPRKPRAVTDADGRFVVWLAGGSSEHKRNMRLYAGKEGYAPGQSAVFELAPGARVDNLMIALDWAGRVEGRVLREDRRPFKGVDVSLTPIAGGLLGVTATSAPAVHARGRTDEDGRFRLEDVPAGTYRMTAWFGRLRLTRDGIVVSRRCTTGGLEFELPTGHGIVGVVLDERARPIRRARVRVEPAAVVAAPQAVQAGRSRNIRPRGQLWANTDSDGRFQVFQLENVIYRVVAARQGFTSMTVPNAVPGGAPLRMVLKHVFAVRGVVLRPDGETPCPEFTIRIFATYRQQPRPGRQQACKDEQGAFSLRPELFSGAPPHSIRISTADGLLSDRVPVSLASGQEPEPVRIVLKRGAEISGVVRTEDGKPVAGASVTVGNKGIGGATPYSRVARTTTRGRFELIALPPGDYTVTAAHRDWVGSSERLTVAGAGKHHLVLTLLREGATLRLTVVDGQGAPVPKAYLSLQADHGRRVGLDIHKYRRLFEEQRRMQPELVWAAFYRSANSTDQAGSLVRRFLPGGRYRVTARAAGFLPATAEVVLASGGGGGLKVVLEKRPRKPAAEGSAAKKAAKQPPLSGRPRR